MGFGWDHTDHSLDIDCRCLDLDWDNLESGLDFLDSWDLDSVGLDFGQGMVHLDSNQGMEQMEYLGHLVRSVH